MIDVEVSWFARGLKDSSADAYVVIDVLRFSTTVAAALASGFREVYVFSELSRAAAFARESKALLAAEVEGAKPAEADLDNSPTAIIDYARKHGVGNGKLVVRTTAGASIVSEAIGLGLKNVFIGSLVNARFVAEALGELRPSSISMVCAGFRRTKFAIEDFLGAGAIICELADIADVNLLDEAIAALHAYLSLRNDLLGAIKSGRSGRFLCGTGRGEDVVFASKVNTVNAVPFLDKHVVREFHRSSLVK